MRAEREHLQREARAVERPEEGGMVVGAGRAGGQQQDRPIGVQPEGPSQELAAARVSSMGGEKKSGRSTKPPSSVRDAGMPSARACAQAASVAPIHRSLSGPTQWRLNP